MNPYQKMYHSREEIYNSIKTALIDEEYNSSAFIADMGLSLDISIADRAFRITSATKGGFSNLFLTVSEFKSVTKNPETVNYVEIPQLCIENKEELDIKDFGRVKRFCFIGDSPYQIPISEIGKEFKYHLLDFISK